MRPKGKTSLLVSASLIASLISILIFAEIISPHPVVPTKSAIALQQKVIGQVGQSQDINLLLDKPDATIRAALSLDISNRHSIISSMQLPGNLESVHIDEDKQLAYLANSFSGLQIIDISDRKHLKILGSLPLPGKAWDIEIVDDTLYLAAAEEGLFVVDISSPKHPVTLSHLRFTDQSILKLAVSAQTIYATTGKKGLLVIDVSNSKSPRLTQTHCQEDGAWGLLADKDRLYVSCGKYSLEVFDISIPVSPRKTGSISLPDAAWDMAIREKTLFLPTRGAGLVVVDVSRADQPVLVSLPLDLKRANNIDLDQDRAYISNRIGHLSILNISEPKAPRLLGQFELPYKPRNITVSGQTIFAATGLTGLQLIETDSLTPIDRSRNLPVPGTVHTALLEAQHIFLATRLQGLFIAEKVQNERPGKIIAKVPVAGFFEGYVKVGTHLFIASNKNTLQVVDISVPTDPQVVAEREFGSDIRDVAAIGTHLFLADFDRGLHVIDISTPSSPTEIGVLPFQGAAKLFADDAYLYLASQYNGLHILSLAAPDVPVEVGTVTLPWPLQNFVTIKDLTVADRTGYLAAGRAGLLVFDVSNPTSPVLHEVIDLNGEVQAVDFQNRRVFCTTRQGKLWSLQKNDNQTHSRSAVMDSLGSGLDLTIEGNQAYIANGLHGLTALSLPQELKIDPMLTTTSRSKRPTRATLRIPAQSVPGIYNLTLFSHGETTEFVGALHIE